jgi:predicted TIM-barrel enzyme
MANKKNADTATSTLEAKEKQVQDLRTQLDALVQERRERELAAADQVRSAQLDAEIARLNADIAREQLVSAASGGVVAQVQEATQAVVEQSEAQTQATEALAADTKEQ